jgi:mRNA interferase MazF
VPDAGDVVWLEFDPQVGHEQAGHRPAVVLSPANYSGRTGLMVCCPLTTRIKGYPFEILLASQSGSAALSDQVKNLDWRARRATRKGKVSDAELRAGQSKAASTDRMTAAPNSSGCSLSGHGTEHRMNSQRGRTLSPVRPIAWP